MGANVERDNKGRFIESREKIRQRIAEKAMVVLLEKGTMSYESIANHAYWVADAMMDEGKK